MIDELAERTHRPSRLRRIIAHPLILLIIAIPLVGGFAWLVTKGMEFVVPTNGLSPAVLATAGALAGIGAYKVYKRWIERTPDRELPLGPELAQLAIGLAAGAGIFALATASVSLMGGFTIMGTRTQTDLGPMLAVGIIAGVLEEIIFRGLMLRLLEKLLGSWIALAITAGFFGLAHLMNPDATLFAALAIAMEAGIMLGAAYLLTRNLWLAIGIHAAWNFTQGWLFSIPVSGGPAPRGLLISQRTGPDWLTGGGFGLEASAVTLVIATLFGLLLLWLAIRRGNLVPAPWNRFKRQTKL